MPVPVDLAFELVASQAFFPGHLGIALILVFDHQSYAGKASPERQMHRILGNVASALSHDGPETNLHALAAVAALQRDLAPDVSVDAGAASGVVNGRQEVISLAARLRGSAHMIRIQFFDADITRLGGTAATMRVTVQVTTRRDGDADVAAAQLLQIGFARQEGRWVVTTAHVVPQGESAL